jgi:hypothetical protein
MLSFLSCSLLTAHFSNYVSKTKMKIILKFLALSVAVSSVSAKCPLCPDGAKVADASLLLIPNGETCGDVEDSIKDVSGGKCDAALAEAVSEFDFAFFCCDAVTTTTVECPICEGADFDPLVVPSEEVNPQQLTCEGIKMIADLTKGSDSFTCQQMQVFADQGCCVPRPAGCSVCPSGSTMGSGNLIMPGGSITCAAFDVELGSQTSEESCTTTLSPYTDYDIAAYCGCTGVAAPATCEGCAAGITGANALVSGTGGQKCSEFEDLADFVVSGCSNWQECCASEVTPQSAAAGISLVMASVVGVLGLVASLA